jgi:hypothetical protein
MKHSRSGREEPQSHTPSQPEPSTSQSKRPLSSSGPPPPPQRSLSGLQRLNIGTPREPEDTTMHDVSDSDQPRKRAAVGDGISAGSGSPYRERESESPPPRRSKARPTSAQFGSSSDPENQRPHVPRKQLYNPDNDALPTRAVFDPSNIASVQAQKSRAQALQPKSRKTFPAPQQLTTTRQQYNAPNQTPMPAAILGSKAATTLLQNPQTSREESYDIIMQPETRPISQEQLVAEVKGIYAGLVMVEAKCIEVDNKQAALAQADGTHSKLNNEQWQALIALHRTLLHEHHDFFLVSDSGSYTLDYGYFYDM